MSYIINEMSKQLEKSTQYYYFSDEMLNTIETNDKAYKWLAEWIFSDGPGSDERYVPDETADYYMDYLTPTEIEYIESTFIQKNWLKSNEAIGAKEKEEPKGKSKHPIGTLIVIQNYGSDEEPSKQSWNGAFGEVRTFNDNGTYSIRITDVKGSKVLFTKKWVGKEPEVLKQILTLKDTSFVTMAEFEAEAEAEASKPKAKPTK